MSRKQAAINNSSAAAAPARASKPNTSRLKSAKHSKATAQESLPAENLNPEVDPAMQAAVMQTLMATEPVMTVEPVFVAESVVIAVTQDGAMQASAPSAEEAREEIARLSYGYWEARGRSEGDPLEDWVRAENEYRQRYSL